MTANFRRHILTAFWILVACVVLGTFTYESLCRIVYVTGSGHKIGKCAKCGRAKIGDFPCTHGCNDQDREYDWTWIPPPAYSVKTIVQGEPSMMW